MWCAIGRTGNTTTVLCEWPSGVLNDWFQGSKNQSTGLRANQHPKGSLSLAAARRQWGDDESTGIQIWKILDHLCGIKRYSRPHPNPERKLAKF